MKPGTPPTATQQATQLIAKATRYDNGFRRQYPLLVEYLDGHRPLKECSMSFYRRKIRAHLRLMESLRNEAARLAPSQSYGD